MQSPPLDSTHGRTTSGVACHLAFGKHTRSKDIWRGMTSSSLKNTNGRTTSGMTCHHCLWTAHTVERRQAGNHITALGTIHTIEQRRAWNDITALGQHTRSDYVGRGMTSPPLDSTHSRTTSGWHSIIAFGQHTRSNDVGEARHHCLLTAHTVKRRRA